MKIRWRFSLRSAPGARRGTGSGASAGPVRKHRRQSVLHELREVPREQRQPRGAAHVCAQADDARTHLRSADHGIDADDRCQSDGPGQAGDCGMGRRTQDRHGRRRRRREDAKPVREPRARAQAQRARLERLGSRPPEFARPVRDRRRSVARSGVAAAAQVGIRLSRRDSALRAGRDRRPPLCHVERRVRVLARCRDRMRPLVFPIAIRRAQRIHGGPHVASVGSAGGLLRRHPRHGVRARREHRRADLEIANRYASARPHYGNTRAPGRPAVCSGRIAGRA